MTEGPPTTDELLDDAEARTGLARNQLLLMVAKSVTVRHLARHAKYGPLFVLKGGTLLTHVYRSPRQSIKDADYTYLEPQTLTTPELDEALTIDGDCGFYLYPEEGVWQFDRDLFDGKTPFSMEGISMGRRARGRELKISVSVRAGERLDPPASPLYYHDPLLARDNTFKINGLTINELAAERSSAGVPSPCPNTWSTWRTSPVNTTRQSPRTGSRSWCARSSPPRNEPAATVATETRRPSPEPSTTAASFVRCEPTGTSSSAASSCSCQASLASPRPKR